MLKNLVVISLIVGISQADILSDAKRAMTNKNYDKAIKLYKKACDSVDTEGCNLLGNMYESGQGVKKSYIKAAEFYKKSCYEGDATGCYYLGNSTFLAGE